MLQGLCARYVPDMISLMSGSGRMKQKPSQTSKSHKATKTKGKPRISTVLDSNPDESRASVADSPNDIKALVGQVAEKIAAEDGLTGVPEEVPKKQWWYAPPDSKVRKHFEKILVMETAGHEDKAIAKRLKTTVGSIRQYRYMAKKNGWVSGDGELVDLETELAMNIDRKIVRNVSASLDGQMTNWQTHEMTIAAAKGRGHFKTHEVSKNDGAAMQMIGVKIIMPPLGAGDQRVEISDSTCGGTPAYVEGEIDVQRFDGPDNPKTLPERTG